MITVALRKESVDRNFCEKLQLLSMTLSLSARRAWIEIGAKAEKTQYQAVALRKESVDRNSICFGSLAGPSGVALRKESVDRNCYYFGR